MDRRIRVILSKDRGPRAGYFLSSLDKKFVMERFKIVTLYKKSKNS